MTRARAAIGRRDALAAVAASGVALLAPKPARAGASPAGSGLNEFLDACFEEQARADPRTMAAMGIAGREGELGATGSRAAREGAALARRQLAILHARFALASLSPDEALSYHLFERERQRIIADEHWWAHYSPISALATPASSLVDFLLTGHAVQTTADARAYVARLSATDAYLEAVSHDLDTIGALGLAPPRAVMPAALSEAAGLLAGAPFGPGADQVLWSDARSKIDALPIATAVRDRLAEDVRAALLGPFRRGMAAYRAALDRLAARGLDDHGLWSKPDGADFYAWVLRNSTTTELTADEIHRLGLAEVARIRGLIDGLRPDVGDAADVDALLAVVRASPNQRYPAGGAGRSAFLAEANALLPPMVAALPRWFHAPPTVAPRVEPVPAWREAASPLASFTPAAQARPATIYFNLAHVDRMLRPQVEATVYHEGLPGHFLQDHYNRQLRGLPRFRTAGQNGGVYYDAWYEGWAVYAEGLSVEMGFCREPAARLGQLASELYRAARLVIDTGLHARRWSRARAIDYLHANSLMPREAAEREVDRYLSFPGQATSYKIGQIEIVRLRGKMQKALGAKFDPRDFHRRFFRCGPLPLDLLSAQFDDFAT